MVSKLIIHSVLAYWGAFTGGANGTEQLKNAHLQCKLYREALFDADVSLWRHIAGGSWQLNNHWATGMLMPSSR